MRPARVANACLTQERHRCQHRDQNAIPVPAAMAMFPPCHCPRLDRIRRLAGLLAALALLPSTLAAPQAALAGPTDEAPGSSAGLRLDPVALDRVTGGAPAPGSQAEADDLAILLWLQRYRTPEMVAATWLLLERNLSTFSGAVGAEVGGSTPALKAGLESFMAPVTTAFGAIKRQRARVRPYVAHAELSPCLPPEATGSFPSGHATWFRATAELLADLLPERRERIERVGRQGGANRVLCGVHYPSDVEAGQRLGAEAARQIIASPQWRSFRQDPRLIQELGRLRNVPERLLPMLVR
jgi:acid phosphatase (class A)